MNDKHVRFVVVWELSPSIEVAAAVLGAKVRSVTRQANRMRAEGVRLKMLTDPKFNPHNKTPTEGPLSTEQQNFMANNYEFARRFARKVCGNLDVAPHKVEDLVEDAAVTGLIRVSQRCTDADFVAETSKGLLATVIRRELWALLRSQLRPVGCGLVEWGRNGRFLNPLQEVIRREEEERMHSRTERARVLIGGLPDKTHHRKSREMKEYLSLRSKAHQLGLKTDGSTDELRERLADHFRNQLDRGPELPEPAAPRVEDPVPECLRRRLTQTPPKSAEQEKAERFVAVWESSATALDSIRAYRTAIQALRTMFPELSGPADVTVELAERFKRQFLAGTYVRGKASDAQKYKRAPTSCTTYLRHLRSLWRKHFKPLGHVKDNPWCEVPYPNAPRGKRVRVPAEETVTAFFDWLAKKHAGWELPRLFVQVKMLAGCRTLDLCKVKSVDLGAETLTLTVEATKTREARTVPIPAEVATALRRLAGPVWLWEGSVEESKQYRPNPRMRAVTEYSPSTWRWTIQNLFREFNEGRADKPRLRPHDLRARAFTVVGIATKNVDATARAMGADVQTARHYLDAAKVFDQSDILKKAASLLLPASEPSPPTEK